MVALAIPLMGVSAGLFTASDFGVDPFLCFSMGVSRLTHIRFGTLFMLLSFVMLAAEWFICRHYIGVSTFLSMFLIGYVSEFTVSGLSAWFGAAGPALRVGYLLVGIVLTCFGAALYYEADLGVSAYDAVSLHMADCRIQVGGRVLPYRFARMGTDLVCVVLGVLLGAPAGIGTVISALFMGPLIAFFRNSVAKPLLSAN